MMLSKYLPVTITVAVALSMLLGCGQSSQVAAASQDAAIVVRPQDANVLERGTTAFSAAVTGTADVSVTWYVLEGSAGGTVTGGVYVAPATAGTYHVVARSVASGAEAQAAVVVLPPGASTGTVASVYVHDAVATAGSTVQMIADVRVNGAPDKSLTWSVDGGSIGSIDPATGVYTTPATAGKYTVWARSNADPTKKDYGFIVVSAPGGTPPAPPGGASVTFTPTAVVATTDVVNSGRGQFEENSSTEYPSGVVRAPDVFVTLLWRQIEKADGVYDWTAIDAAMARAAAPSKLGRVGIRVTSLNTNPYLQGTYQGAYTALPDFLIGQVNPLIAQGYSHLHAIPDWNHPRYLSKLQALLNAIGSHYASNARFGWMEMSGYGNWGEWHLYPFTDQRPITDANARAIVQMHVAAFPGKRLFSFTANRPALDEAMNASPDIGIRIDGIGAMSSGGDMAGAASNMASVPASQYRWQTAPIIGERLAGDSEIGDIFTNMEKQVRQYHISAIGAPRELPPTTEAEMSAYLRANSEMGFRLRASFVKITASSTGATTMIEFVNDGTAPTYSSWNVSVVFRNVVSGSSVQATIPVDLRAVAPGTPVQATSAMITGLATGDHDVYLKVEDPQKALPNMALAQTGLDQSAGAAQYLLGRIRF
jgi:hypothetical protein